MRNTPDIGTPLVNLEMDWQLARQFQRRADLAAGEIDDDEVAGRRVAAEAARRHQDALGIGGARADVTEAFNEAAVEEEAPRLRQLLGDLRILVHDDLDGAAHLSTCS